VFLKHQYQRLEDKKKRKPTKKSQAKQLASSVRQAQDDPDFCFVCTALEKHELEDLKTEWLEHGTDENTLAEKYEIDVKDIQKHLRKCLINKHRSRYERLAMVLNDIFDDIDIARKEFQADPTFHNSASYQGLIREFRGVIGDLENIQNAAELSDELTKLVLNPLTKQITQIIISEVGTFKEEISIRFGEEETDRLINELVLRIGKQFEQSLVKAHDRMEQALSARDKNRKSFKGRATARLGKGSQPSPSPEKTA
jgi:hypothetical protein